MNSLCYFFMLFDIQGYLRTCELILKTFLQTSLEEFRNVHITLKEETEVTFLLPPSSSSSLSLLLMKHSCRFLWLWNLLTDNKHPEAPAGENRASELTQLLVFTSSCPLLFSSHQSFILVSFLHFSVKNIFQMKLQRNRRWNISCLEDETLILNI